MNPNPKENTLPRPKVALREPFDDLFGNIESKVLTLALIGSSLALEGNHSYQRTDLINAIDLLHTEILDGINTLQQNFSRL